MNKIQKCGLPPGTLLYTGQRAAKPSTVSVFDYSKATFNEEVIADLNVLSDYKERETVTWVNLDGLNDTQTMEKIGQIFNIHPLVLEDIMNVEQRPKIDVYNDYIFIIIKMLNYNEKLDTFESEQLALIFGKNFVISFQEETGDAFDSVRERIRKGGRMVEKGADFLAYTLLDTIVDTYFHVMERMGEWIENLEHEILKRPKPRRTFEISDLKRDAIFLRRNIWPVREVVHGLQRSGEEGLIQADTMFFFNDLYDHVIQIMDAMENYRDMIANLMELYLSNISQKMNEVMKTLTMIATIFIPITFITSLYGMNFKHMPELDTEYGYFVVLGIIVIVSIGMVVYFKRRNWF